MGGRIVGAQVVEVGESGYAKIQELHSTKGWRAETWVSLKHFGWQPIVGTFSWESGCGPHASVHGIRTLRASEINLWRHGWYRRKMRKEAGLEELHANL